MSERSREHASLGLFGDGYGLDREAIEAFTADYLPNPNDRDSAYASPLRASELAGLARAHVLTAEFDPLRDSGEAYARRLQEAGVKTTLHRFTGQTHGSSGLWQSWPPARAWMDEVVGAIRDAVPAPVPVAPREKMTAASSATIAQWSSRCRWWPPRFSTAAACSW